MKIRINHCYRFILISSILIFCLTSHSNSQVILTEVMFDPIGSEHYNEFIEIYNTSETDTIDLAGWQLSDSIDVDNIILYEQGTKLSPQHFALILDPGYFENSRQYENLIPPEALILTIDDGSFGSQGLSNSYPEAMMLISSSGDTIAKYRYTLDNQPGYSDEKRNLSRDDSPGNWSNSNVLNGTPGFPNSVRQLNHDVSIQLLAFPPEALPGQSVSLIASVLNIGLFNVTNFEVLFFEDRNLDYLLSDEEQIGSPTIFPDSLKQGENYQVQRSTDSLLSGVHSFYAKAIYPFDEDTVDNLASSLIKIGFSKNSAVINEIMYRPSVEQTEWFELYNPGDQPIDLRCWQFSDSRTENRIDILDSLLSIPAKGFLIIAEDSSVYQNFSPCPDNLYIPSQGFPALNNGGDQIVVYDLTGTEIDQVSYQPSWGSELGVSLERIRWDSGSDDPSNWALSENFNGGTPGYKNSISPGNHDLSLSISIETGYPDSITVFAKIFNIGLLPAAQFQCDFYLDKNYDSLAQQVELVYSFINDLSPLLPTDSIMISHSIPIDRQGLNQVIARLIYNLDENQSDNLSVVQLIVPFNRGQVVINEIMFQPLSNESEWIELFNPGMDSINLFQWKFSDATSQQKHIIVEHPFWCSPKDYVLLAESETVFARLADSLFGKVIIPQSWPTLNNTFDQVVLYDLTEKTIDSMAYFSGWIPGAGISLERVEVAITSSDSSNWEASIDTTGSTPGRFNSVSPVNYDLSLAGINIIPDNPFPDEEIILSVKVNNDGLNVIRQFQLSLFIDLNQDSIFQPDEKIGELFTISHTLEQDESVSVEIPYVPTSSGLYLLRATVIFLIDQRQFNNSYSEILSVGFKNQSFVINEIMYSPFPEQTEWIELFNPHAFSIDIQNWSFSDSDSSEKKMIFQNHLQIAPHTFLILVPDSSILELYDLNYTPLISKTNWPGLNNSEDKIFIFDQNENIIDEMQYTSKWGGGEGISLERINPDLASTDSNNWSSCVHISGGTPGLTNSIFVDVLPSEAGLSISPNPFSPDNDGRDDVTIITYQLPFNLSQIHVKIFDIRGRQVRFLVNNRPAGTSGSLIWDGRDDRGHICRMGIYIIYLEAIHYQRGVVKSLKKSVVLARQL